MKRQIILDTETTGLNPKLGDRVIEIGCVELVNRKLTGNNFHRYINPERDSDERALEIHGLTTEFLRDKPKFSEIIKEFIVYVHDAEIVIHNAPFDVGFLNAEFERLGVPKFVEHVSDVIDTLVQAKELHPGKRNSLDALCTRYEISNSHRKLHGALLDAELLADVFIAMSRGQNSFGMEEDEVVQVVVEGNDESSSIPMPEVLVMLAESNSLVAHDDIINGLGDQSFWRQLQANRSES